MLAAPVTPLCLFHPFRVFDFRVFPELLPGVLHCQVSYISHFLDGFVTFCLFLMSLTNCGFLGFLVFEEICAFSSNDIKVGSNVEVDGAPWRVIGTLLVHSCLIILLYSIFPDLLRVLS